MLNKMGARAEPYGTPFLRRHNLLRGPLPVVRVKLRLRTSSMMNFFRWLLPFRSVVYVLILKIIS